jgi:hypothetical protein
MIRFIILSLLILVTAGSSAQQSSDWGITAGSTTYYGDINPGKIFSSPGVGAGAFYRYNFHPRHSFRASLITATLSGSDLNSDNTFYYERGESFSGIITEMAGIFEFNFFPYSTAGKRWGSSPYLAGGLAICFINTGVNTYSPVIPIAFGYKVNFYKNLGLEFEYGFRKTFYDNFDGLIDPVDEGHQAWTHNNDWYTFAGVSLTWKMFNRLMGCPAYDETKSYQKRRRR